MLSAVGLGFCLTCAAADGAGRHVAGYAVQQRDVPTVSESGDTASTRVTIDESVGAQQLIQRVITFDKGLSRIRTAADRDEIGYVVEIFGPVERPYVAVTPNDGVATALLLDSPVYTR